MATEIDIRLVIDQEQFGIRTSLEEKLGIAQSIADTLKALGITIVKMTPRGMLLRAPSEVYETAEIYNPQTMDVPQLPKGFPDELSAYVRSLYIPTKPEYY